MGQRTALANQMRGMLFEYGLVVAKGVGTLLRRVVELVEDADNGLPWAMRELLAGEREELVRLDERVKHFDAQLDAFAHEDEACRRLPIPGVGPKVATALVAAAGDARQRARVRRVAGADPAPALDRGAHGARPHQQARGPLLRAAAKRKDRRSRMANKSARTAWALLQPLAIELRHRVLDGGAEYRGDPIDLVPGQCECGREDVQVADGPHDEAPRLRFARNALPDLDVVAEGFLRRSVPGPTPRRA